MPAARVWEVGKARQQSLALLLGFVSLLLHAVWSPVVDGTTSRFYRIILDLTKLANYSEPIKPRPWVLR